MTERQAARSDVPKGERKCEHCELYHPERKERPCSAFGELQNKDGCCSLYIDRGKGERIIWR